MIVNFVSEKAKRAKKSTSHEHSPRITPRCLSRVDAAFYIAISPSLFDEMVKDGRMPQPFRINARVLWDRKELDGAIDALKDEPQTNPWDEVAS